jgi:cytochrome c peroxidase
MPKRTSVEEPAQLMHYYSTHITELDTALSDLLRLVNTNSPADSIQAAFRKARIGYKKIEFMAEYFNPYTAKAINGAAIYEVEEDDPLQKLVSPTGFQVAEALVFPAYDKANKEGLVQEINLIKSSLNRLRLVSETTAMSDRHIFDAMRQQIFRIITLGISGFDSPIALHSMPEAAASLQSLQETFTLYKHDLQKISPDLSQEIEHTFSGAITYLQANTEFNTFDRAIFITTYANPLTTILAKARDALAIAIPSDLRAFSSKAYTLFDEGAFNVNYYAPSYQAHLTPERIALGKMLFFDPVLSGNGSRSCASCHNPEKAFTDGKTKSIAFDFKGSVSRNSPTLLNAALQSSLFHDMRVNFLEDQASEVVNNSKEMHGSFKEAAVALKQSPEYVHLFDKAFPESADSSLTEQQIKIAIASYVRSLISLNSRFDQYMRGDATQLTAQELKGLTLFMGKAKCGTCHFMPLFNGTVPPNFAQTEAEILGVPATTDTLNSVLDADLGKFDLYNKDLHKYAFKTPTLRNVALTAPYMHNGVYSTLEEVIDFYDRGGGLGMGIDISTQTLPPDKLDLHAEEKEALVAFMQTLTDTTGVTDVPQHLPLFPKQVVLNKRKVGGKY